MLQQHPTDIPAPPPAPAAPASPPAPAVAGVLVGGQTQALTGVPRTAKEYAALRRRRSELSDQLTSASSRRSQLVRQIEGMDPIARAGVQQRIELLDQRILQLESDIALTGQQVAAATDLVSTTQSSRPSFPVNNARMNYTVIALAFMFAVMMPIAIAIARLIWKRTTAPVPRRSASTEDSQRLLRLEQAIDTIAIEVERVSEGQRYVTQLMAEGAHQRVLEGTQVGSRER